MSSNYIENLSKRTTQTLIRLSIKVVREVTSHTGSYIRSLRKEPLGNIALTLHSCSVEERTIPTSVAFPIQKIIIDWTFVACVVVEVRS